MLQRKRIKVLTLPVLDSEKGHYHTLFLTMLFWISISKYLEHTRKTWTCSRKT
jgi:hypothetical protein